MLVFVGLQRQEEGTRENKKLGRVSLESYQVV